MSFTPQPSRPIVGEKYDAALDVKDIAKLIRKDIKAAAAEGKLPALATKANPDGMKVTVRIDRYSMGQAIHVHATIPGPDRVPATDERSSVYGRPDDEWLDWTATAEQVAVDRTLSAILDKYNYDNSDSLTDYYENHFAGLVAVRGTEEVARA